jgi:hypothetical protein
MNIKDKLISLGMNENELNECLLDLHVKITPISTSWIEEAFTCHNFKYHEDYEILTHVIFGTKQYSILRWKEKGNHY